MNSAAASQAFIGELRLHGARKNLWTATAGRWTAPDGFYITFDESVYCAELWDPTDNLVMRVNIPDVSGPIRNLLP